MTTDRHEDRRPSTWWVGRGRKPRRWWDDGVFGALVAAYVAWCVSYDPSERGWSLVAAQCALVAVLLVDGYVAAHGMTATLARTCTGAVLVYVVAAAAAVKVLELDAFAATTLSIPLAFSTVIIWCARRRRRRARE